MKWWVFNEEQLAPALSAYRDRQRKEFPVTVLQVPGQIDVPSGTMTIVCTGADDIIEFLNSPEARAQNLRGDK